MTIALLVALALMLVQMASRLAIARKVVFEDVANLIVIIAVLQLEARA